MSNEHDPWGQPPKKKDKPEGPARDEFGGPPDLDELIQRFTRKFSGKKGNKAEGSPSGGGQIPLTRLIGSVCIVLLVVWAGSGFYIIDEQERAVVLRLGKYHDTLAPGLQWQPYYIDDVTTVNVTSVRDRLFDNKMLTKDENIVEVGLQVQYLVSDPKFFVLNVRDPENALSLATDSALRNVVGKTNLDDVITTGRQLVADQVRERTQAFLDDYMAGLSVRKVNVSTAKPPDEVKPAFDDVIKAREDKVRSVNKATAYENSIVPLARGEAKRLLEEAQGYKQSIIDRAKGDSDRFLQLLAEYRKAPEVTKRRLYLDTMESVLSNTSKVLLDVGQGNSLMYLPIDQIINRQQSNNTDQADVTNSQNQSGIDSLQNRVINRLRNQSSQLREGR